MIVSAIETRLSNKGVASSGPVAHIIIDSFIKKSTTRNFRSSQLETSAGICTSSERIPENVVLQINGEWFKPITHDVGMAGQYRTYLQATTDPRR